MEEHTGTPLTLSTEIDEERDIVPLLNEVSKARKEAQLDLMEQGFEDKCEIFGQRKKRARKKGHEKGHGQKEVVE